MKKLIKRSVLMASLAAAGMGAQAEGISFYALLDGGVAHTAIKGTGTTTSKTEFVTGGFAPNFAGVTGEKSLDKGFSAGFKLEQGFLLNNARQNQGTPSNSRFFFGDDSVFNRQANLFIKNSALTFTAGTQPNIAFNSVLMADPRSGSNFGSSLAAVVISGGLGTIDNGSLSLTSAPMSGFTLGAQYVPQESATSSAKTASRLTVTYATGDLAATLATYSNTSNTTDPDSTGYVAGATYKLGAFTLKGLNVSQKKDPVTLKTNGLGGSYALSANTTFDFGTYQSTKKNYSMSTNAVGVYHKFLKDLTIYGQYASVKNKGTDSTPYNFAPPMVVNDGFISTSQTATTLNVGLLYSFF
jgi:predicted porin